ncbi:MULTISPECIES: zinc ribbon domain-containing protein [Enorma]|uniref:zinc ribbon domain-containing protein n=1 Tax=Enorma TaxID=1472762 RepID=UPI000349BA1E|nr:MULTISPECIES: zinc ribbon domain-containing protein [Enorma]
MSFCTTCGAPLKPGARFCEQCGSPVGVAAPAASQPARPAPAARQQPAAAQPAAASQAANLAAQQADAVKRAAQAVANAAEARIDAARAAAGVEHDSPRHYAMQSEASTGAIARSAAAPAGIVAASTAIEIAPYASPFSDEEREASAHLPASAPKHARKMCEKDIAEVSRRVNSLAVSIREHVKKAARDDMDAVQYAGAIIDQMGRDGTYHSDVVPFNELETVTRYRANIKERLDADRTVIKDVSAWLDYGVPTFVDDARALAVRMWGTFDQSVLDRAQADYDAAAAAYDQAKQSYLDTAVAYDEKVRLNTKQNIEPSYALPMSASFRRYAKLFLWLVILTLVLSLVCWLFLHVAIIIMALPIVRLIGIIGAIGFFVASIVMERGVERKRTADLNAQNAAIIAWNAQLQAERQQALVQPKAAMDAAEERKNAARKALEQAKQSVDPDERVAFTSLTNTFVQALDALNRAIEPVIAAIGKQWPIDGFEQAIDDDWMDQLKRHDPPRYMMLHTERSNELQSAAIAHASEVQEKEAKRQTAEQARQTSIAEKNLAEARKRRQEASMLDRQRTQDNARAAAATVRARRAQESAAWAQENEAWAGADANRATERAEDARRASYNRN